MSLFADLAERHSQARILGSGALLLALSLLGTVWAEGILDAVLALTAALVAGGTGAMAWTRARLDALPLELAADALRGERSGVAEVRVRVRLGRGRVMRADRVDIRWRTAQGEATLDAPIPAPVLCGPWTVLARDPEGHTRHPGTLAVRVEVREGRRIWQVEREWPSERLRAGLFAPAVLRQRGRVAFDHERWDEVIERDAGELPSC